MVIMSSAGARVLVVVIGLLLLPAMSPGAVAVYSDSTDHYRSYFQVLDELIMVTEEHGDIAALFSIGITYEEREIWALKVSDNPYEDEDEPEVLFTGAHHAKEWPSVEVVMATIHLVVNSYGNTSRDADGDGFDDDDNDRDGTSDEDPFNGEDDDGDGEVDEDWSDARLSWLVDNRQIWFIPVLNPDGLEYCRDQVINGVMDESQLWRKNREPNYDDLGPLSALTYGVDLNRNYGFHWGELGAQSQVNSDAEDYIGPRDKNDDDGDRRINEDPMDNEDNDGDGSIDEDTRGGFSELETLALKELVEEHDFIIALHFHTYKGTIYWPWMWTLQLPAHEDTFMGLAVGMNVFNGYDYRDMSERNQQTLSRHPPVDGDSNDWMYGKHGVLSYTIELGYNEFIPSPEELTGIVADNLGANLFVIEAADNPDLDDITLTHLPKEEVPGTEGVELEIKVGGGELVSGGILLHYRVGDGSFETVTMTASGAGGVYSATVNGLEEGDVVEYYFVAETTSRGTEYLPAYGPYEVFTLQVGEEPSSVAGLGLGIISLILVLAVLAVVFRSRTMAIIGTVKRRMRIGA